MSDTNREDLIEETLGEAQPKAPKSDPPIKPKSAKSVAVYLVILFAAAFVLLLMAYFMQQRTNNEVIDNLQDSVNQFKTLDELREENQQLREELEEVEESLSSAADELEEAKSALAQKEAELDASAALREETEEKLLSWSDFWDIEYLYRTEQYQACADHIRLLSGSTYYVTPSGEFVSERCQEIRNTLIDLGYLQEEEAPLF